MSLVLSTILCILLLHETRAYKEPTITKSLQSNGTNPSIVFVEATGYLTLTIDKNILAVQSTFPGDKNKINCKLIVDPYEDAIIGRVKTLTFQQSIIVWGVRSVEIVDEIKKTRYTMLIVDPRGCSYKPLQLPIDEVPMDHSTLPPEVTVVPHISFQRSFNVFFPTLTRCAPCWYDPKAGAIVKLDTEVRPPVMKFSRALYVRSFNEMNDQINNGYLLAYNYGIGTSRIEYLDKNFTCFARRYLNHNVDATSVVLNADSRQNIAACWHHDDSQITCQRFDSRLYPATSYNVQGDSVSMLFDKNENAYIATAKKSGRVHLYIFNAYGRIVDEFDFGTVGNSTKQLEVGGFLDYFDRPASEYCLSVVEFQDSDDVKADYFVKCIDVKQYTKMP